MNISIIIPVFNEEQNIGLLLDLLLDSSTQPQGKPMRDWSEMNFKFRSKPRSIKHFGGANKEFVDEIIVVDGGSDDRTIEVAKHYDKVKIISSEKGRAKQMNAGAKIATSEVLYFLHADSHPPFHYDYHIISCIKNGNKAGCFLMKFDKNHWWLKLMAQFTRLNHRSCRGGDQSLFILKDLFFKLGGYNEQYIVYEDNEFIGKLYDEGEFTVIKKWVTTSARLYEKLGVWQTQWLFCQIYWKKFKGDSPDQLYSYYQSKVNSSN
ncbi:TIGR04283 family arsenosugar biosynthesis glycosyltransferase [Zunongwangia endophytica]|uniref:TIGR04283 family arsenosugar biosynthesis glycosyltransferase n=1 Tax=Zunongwangia endophytica TaxID=1808945 RepID=A0ABV8H595_9FLAO|nr:TIGR04283 family arsenosugar biosynthesis glycosyltransferase [Zunongwangia endophytica]MDN3595445.1 TIGR04283 family arsenosugar biosynthesis glycosyltransferase [Zunongwangia endophytica]